MKKALCIITAICCSSAILSSCSDKNKETIYDVGSNYEILDSELAEELELQSAPLNTVISDYKQDSYKKEMLNAGASCTFDNRFMYLFNHLGTQGSIDVAMKMQYYKIDLQSGDIISMCSDPGCTHNPGSYPNCINNKFFEFPTAVGDCVWYIEGNKIFELKDGKSSEVYENTYFTDFEIDNYKDIAPNAECGLYNLIIDDDLIYAFGPSYTFKIQRNTMEASDLVNISDDALVLSSFIYNDKAYVCNELQELFVADYETGEVTKLGDKINTASVYNDVLYYTRYNGGKPILYTADLDGSGEKKLLDDCYMDFFIKDGKVFYHNNGTGNSVRSYDLSTGENKDIFDDWEDVSCVVTANHIDRIFAIGCNEDGESVVISVRSDGSDLWAVTIDGRDSIS